MLEAKRPEKPGKKKQQEKKKSNLEIFKEELKAIQVSELINLFSLRRWRCGKKARTFVCDNFLGEFNLCW